VTANDQSPAILIARLDRSRVWSLPCLFVGIIGVGFPFTFYDIFDINVSFIQTCIQIVPHCTPPSAANYIGLPVLLNLIGYVIGTLILSPLPDRAGRWDLLLVTMVITGIGSVLTAVVDNYAWFVVARAITGIGIGADLAIVNTYVNEMAPREGRASYMALLFSAIGAVLGIWRGSRHLARPVAYQASNAVAAGTAVCDRGTRIHVWLADHVPDRWCARADRCPATLPATRIRALAYCSRQARCGRRGYRQNGTSRLDQDLHGIGGAARRRSSGRYRGEALFRSSARPDVSRAHLRALVIGSLVIFFGFNLWVPIAYSWTTENFPTGARTTGFAVVDGVGHLGGGIGVLIVAPLIPHMGALRAMLLIADSSSARRSSRSSARRRGVGCSKRFGHSPRCGLGRPAGQDLRGRGTQHASAESQR
jgi:sugar transport protein